MLKDAALNTAAVASARLIYEDLKDMGPLHPKVLSFRAVRVISLAMELQRPAAPALSRSG